ncbi:hypothetical protein EYV96_15665 [Dyella terrae]|uniref:Uncharacterized protein n=1 Tax=Dyella terrae TaxID=522259 RepID=A0ABY1YPE5_9GAMM|nr:hypothetical protein EYV96_15665 [Dyella terrae]
MPSLRSRTGWVFAGIFLAAFLFVAVWSRDFFATSLFTYIITLPTSYPVVRGVGALLSLVGASSNAASLVAMVGAGALQYYWLGWLLERVVKYG